MADRNDRPLGDDTPRQRGRRGSTPQEPPALTIKQPWASLIVHGVKNVENRSWATRYRGPIWVHAGAHHDHSRQATTLLRRYSADMVFPTRAVVGSVTISDCIRDHDSDWADRNYWHWILTDPEPLAAPIPARGAQGLWVWSPHHD